jgi:hypothetical protein
MCFLGFGGSYSVTDPSWESSRDSQLRYPDFSPLKILLRDPATFRRKWTPRSCSWAYRSWVYIVSRLPPRSNLVTYLLETKKYKACSAKQENCADNIRRRVWELFQPFDACKNAGIVPSGIRGQTSHHWANNNANVRTHWENQKSSWLVPALIRPRLEHHLWNSLLLPNNFTNHSPHNANISIQSTSQHPENQSLPKSGRESESKTRNHCTRKANQKHSFSSSMIGSATP